MRIQYSSKNSIKLKEDRIQKNIITINSFEIKKQVKKRKKLYIKKQN